MANEFHLTAQPDTRPAAVYFDELSALADALDNTPTAYKGNRLGGPLRGLSETTTLRKV